MMFFVQKSTDKVFHGLLLLKKYWILSLIEVENTFCWIVIEKIIIWIILLFVFGFPTYNKGFGSFV